MSLFNRNQNVNEEAAQRGAEGHSIFVVHFTPVRQRSGGTEALADRIESVESAGWQLDHVSPDTTIISGNGSTSLYLIFRKSAPTS
jgi:hypothetical protein